jgi:hypothetical protein
VHVVYMVCAKRTLNVDEQRLDRKLLEQAAPRCFGVYLIAI